MFPFLIAFNVCPACPVECLPRGGQNLFLCGEAYASGVAPADGTG